MNDLLRLVAIFVLVSVVLYLWAVLGRNLDRRRTKKLSEVAGTIGFLFQPSAEQLERAVAGRLALLDCGELSNLLRGGVEGAELMLVDRNWKFPEGDQQWVTLAVMRTTGPNGLPHFRMVPKDGRYALDSIFDQEIRIENAPKFSERYVVSSDNPDAVRVLLALPVVDFFSDPEQPWWAIEAAAEWMTVHRAVASGDWRIRPEDMERFVSAALVVFRLFAPAIGPLMHPPAQGDTRTQ